MTSSGSIDTAGLVSTFSVSWGGAGFESGVTDIMGGASVGTTIDRTFAFNAGTDFSAWQTANPWDSDFFGFDTITGTHAFATYASSGGNVPGLSVYSGDLTGSIWTSNQQWTESVATFATLGLNEGTYTIADAVSSESITFQIGSVPEPSSAALILAMAGLTVVGYRRRR